VVLAALGVFGWLAYGATLQPISVSLPWMIVLVLATLVSLGVSGTLLWRRTRFS
jgi:membrane protein YdbS with pleckstrin-like domain